MELHREAELAGFRPATLKGVHPRELRERALAQPQQRLTFGHLALAVLLVGGGFFLGRALVARWRKRKSTVGVGLDVFVAGR
jgi:hypothetical protein